MLCVLIVEGMSVVVNVMLSLMSVMSPPSALCNLSLFRADNVWWRFAQYFVIASCG